LAEIVIFTQGHKTYAWIRNKGLSVDNGNAITPGNLSIHWQPSQLLREKIKNHKIINPFATGPVPEVLLLSRKVSAVKAPLYMFTHSW